MPLQTRFKAMAGYGFIFKASPILRLQICSRGIIIWYYLSCIDLGKIVLLINTDYLISRWKKSLRKCELGCYQNSFFFQLNVLEQKLRCGES